MLSPTAGCVHLEKSYRIPCVRPERLENAHKALCYALKSFRDLL
jgi:hypothetical protein